MDVKLLLLQMMQEKLDRLGIHSYEINDKFDLVKSGLLNSLEFVDLVASVEKKLGIEIDFETALENGDFTTMQGIINTIKKYLDGKS
jgi:acyl carrier protein